MSVYLLYRYGNSLAIFMMIFLLFALIVSQISKAIQFANSLKLWREMRERFVSILFLFPFYFHLRVHLLLYCFLIFILILILFLCTVAFAFSIWLDLLHYLIGLLNCLAHMAYAHCCWLDKSHVKEAPVGWGQFQCCDCMPIIKDRIEKAKECVRICGNM